MIIVQLVFAALAINACRGRTLKMVHLLYRHGARSPVAFYPNDKYQAKDWPDGSGRLTQIGMNMEYQLGKFLKQRYMMNISFVDESYLHKQVYIRSSDVERCLQSAEAQLAGLYPPQGYQVWNTKIPWQPIPVHTVPKDEDVILRSYDVYCPRLEEIWSKQKERPDYKKKVKENEELFKTLSTYSGLEEVTPDNLYHITDPTICEKTQGFKIPKWIIPLWDKTNVLVDWFFLYKFTGDDELGRLLGGSFLGMINDNMKKLSTNVTESLFKMNIFSAHDTSLLAFSTALDVKIDFPIFSSCIVVELYQSDVDYFVEIYYRNSYTDDLEQLKLRECEFSCPLHEFLKITGRRTTTVAERSKICGFINKGDLFNTYNLKIIAIVLSCVSFILLIILFYFIIKQSYSGYRYTRVEI